MAFPGAWEEVALVEVQILSAVGASTGLKWQFAALTDSIDISEPDFDGETLKTVAGGDIWKDNRPDPGEVTLEMYPIELDAADDADNKGLFQQYWGRDDTAMVGVYSTSEPLVAGKTGATDQMKTGIWHMGQRDRDRFRVCVLWTNDTTPPTKASGVTAASTDSLRFVALGCRMTSHKAAFTDGILKVTATFKFPAFNKAGTTKMWQWQSDSQSGLTTTQLGAEYDDVDSFA